MQNLIYSLISNILVVIISIVLYKNSNLNVFNVIFMGLLVIKNYYDIKKGNKDIILDVILWIAVFIVS